MAVELKDLFRAYKRKAFGYCGAEGSASVAVYTEDGETPCSDIQFSLSISGANFTANLTPDEAMALARALNDAAYVHKSASAESEEQPADEA